MKTIIDKILSVTNEHLDSLDTSFFNSYNFYHDIGYVHLESGKEHYRLLCYIASLFNKDLIFDIGTNRCMSAAALSSAFTNRVKSYDLIKILPVNPILPNVQYILGDVTKDETLKDAKFIFFDAAHDGIFENIFYDHLHKIEYKGLLMLDDIHLNDEMKKFHGRISEDCWDLTKKGHWSGSAIVNFS
jgi:hypothetical protein